MTWKKALLIALVVVIVLTGAPILMGGMGGAMCPDCGPAVVARACADFAVFSPAVLLLLILAIRLRRRDQLVSSLVLVSRLERPPRVA